jgi:hypothetical protein
VTSLSRTWRIFGNVCQPHLLVRCEKCFRLSPPESPKAIAEPKQWMLHAPVIPLTPKRLTKISARSLHRIDTKSRGGIHGHYDIFCELRHGTSDLRSSSKTVGTAWPLDRESRATKIVLERARAHEITPVMRPVASCADTLDP